MAIEYYVDDGETSIFKADVVFALNPIKYIDFPKYSYTGNGTIGGLITTKDRKTPNAQVLLFCEESNELVSTTIASATGVFIFENLNQNLTYFIIVKNPVTKWEHRISSRRKPVVT